MVCLKWYKKPNLKDSWKSACCSDLHASDCAQETQDKGASQVDKNVVREEKFSYSSLTVTFIKGQKGTVERPDWKKKETKKLRHHNPHIGEK